MRYSADAVCILTYRRSRPGRGDLFRDPVKTTDRIPVWAKHEHMERIAPQKELRDYTEDSTALGAIAFSTAARRMNVEKPGRDAEKKGMWHFDAGEGRNQVLRRIPSHMGSAH